MRTWETFDGAGCDRNARHKGNRGRVVVEGVGYGFMGGVGYDVWNFMLTPSVEVSFTFH